MIDAAASQSLESLRSIFRRRRYFETRLRRSRSRSSILKTHRTSDRISEDIFEISDSSDIIKLYEEVAARSLLEFYFEMRSREKRRTYE